MSLHTHTQPHLQVCNMALLLTRCCLAVASLLLCLPAVFATLDTIVDYFRSAGVSFNAVRLRRHVTSKMFKGSLFIELTDKAEADRVSCGV